MVVGNLPLNGDQWMVAIDTGAFLELKIMETGETVSKPTCQILARDRNYPSPQRQLRNCTYNLSQLRNVPVTNIFANGVGGIASGLNQLTPTGYVTTQNDVGDIVNVISGSGVNPGAYTILSINSSGEWVLSGEPFSGSATNVVWNIQETVLLNAVTITMQPTFLMQEEKDRRQVFVANVRLSVTKGGVT
jgi:hypothetical protein